MQVGALAEVPTLNFASSSERAKTAREVAGKHFNALSKQRLNAACLAWKDDVRKQIDDVVADMLGFGEKERKVVESLRKSWCFEPLVHGGKKQALALIESKK